MGPNYTISDDKSLLDREVIKGFLASSYWANHRTPEQIDLSIDNSFCFGVYMDGAQVGFARIITDFATIFLLCDVFVIEAYRGHGIGKALIQHITGDDRFRNLVGYLGTLDAHGLYEQYEFEREPHRFMRRIPDYARNQVS